MVSKRLPTEQRQAAWRGIVARRADAARLVAQLDLRLQCFDPLLIRLVDLCREMLAMKDDVDVFDGSGAPERDLQRRTQLFRLMACTRESPKTLARHVRRTLAARRQYLAARQFLAVSNLRLVVSIAKHYRRWGLTFQDLIQEGNVGLLRAVDKFDHGRGHRFSTYAIWWIRQSVTRALAEQGRTIRLPFHLHGPLRRVQNAVLQHLVTHGREPSPEELAQLANLTVTESHCLIRLSYSPLSLDQPTENADNSLREVLADPRQEDPLLQLGRKALKEEVAALLESLEQRERKVLELRYGLLDGCSRSLVEVGELMELSRESIRQIEKRAFCAIRQKPEFEPLLELVDLTQAPDKARRP